MTNEPAPAETARPTLALRPLRDTDAALFVEAYTVDAPHLGPLDAAGARLLFARACGGGAGTFFVVLADGVAAGIAGLVPRADGCREAGVVLAPSWRGRGLGTRVFARLISDALRLDDGEVCVVRHAPGHAAMAAIAARLRLRPLPGAGAGAWTATR